MSSIENTLMHTKFASSVYSILRSLKFDKVGKNDEISININGNQCLVINICTNSNLRTNPTSYCEKYGLIYNYEDNSIAIYKENLEWYKLFDKTYFARFTYDSKLTFSQQLFTHKVNKNLKYLFWDYFKQDYELKGDRDYDDINICSFIEKFIVAHKCNYAYRNNEYKFEVINDNSIKLKYSIRGEPYLPLNIEILFNDNKIELKYDDAENNETFSFYDKCNDKIKILLFNSMLNS